MAVIRHRADALRYHGRPFSAPLRVGTEALKGLACPGIRSRPCRPGKAKGTRLADLDLASRLGLDIARGAVVASLTIVFRILGLVRTLVFSQTVGASCLGTAYVTANQVPDLLYNLILGGALGSALVPVLARSAQRAAADPAEKARVDQISSAMLT